MNLLGFLAAATVAFGAAYLFLPWLIRSLRGTSLVGKDLNKADQRLVPEMGGVAVILGFYVGVATLTVLAFDDISGAVYFAALSASLGAGVVGLMDDMFRLSRSQAAGAAARAASILLHVHQGSDSSSSAADSRPG